MGERWQHTLKALTGQRDGAGDQGVIIGHRFADMIGDQPDDGFCRSQAA